MSFYDTILRHTPHKTAIIIDDLKITYGEFIKIISSIKLNTTKPYPIKEKDFISQLAEFISSEHNGLAPVILPKNFSGDISSLPNSDFGICTSGTTGIPKIVWRTNESWTDFFDTQNKIFKITDESIVYAPSTLCFSGTLNTVLSVLHMGGAVAVCTKKFVKSQLAFMDKHNVDVIYSIPDKLSAFARSHYEPNTKIKSILSGSQSVDAKTADIIKNTFPNAQFLLYYGLSELSFVSYTDDFDDNCIGKPFPNVKVYTEDNRICVDTPYSAIGIDSPYKTNDLGHFCNGKLYFDGRYDDVINIKGEKFSALTLENAINKIIDSECAVKLSLDLATGKAVVTVYLPEKFKPFQQQICETLRKQFPPYMQPKKWVYVSSMPQNDAGKIVKHLLP